MCWATIDNWVWRGDPNAVSYDHVRKPYFVPLDSNLVLYLRGVFAGWFIIMTVLHLVFSGVEFWYFATCWNLLVVTLTFVLLLIASWIHRNDPIDHKSAVPYRGGTVLISD